MGKHLTDTQIQEIHSWYMSDDSRTFEDITTVFNLPKQTIIRRFKKLNLASKGFGYRAGTRRGPNSPSWKGGHHFTGENYIRIWLEVDDPYYCMTMKNGYVLEQRYVMAQYLGRPLYDWETVHHGDGDRTNNDISNLQLRIGKHGKGQAYACMECGSKRIEPVDLD